MKIYEWILYNSEILICSGNWIILKVNNISEKVFTQILILLVADSCLAEFNALKFDFIAKNLHLCETYGPHMAKKIEKRD